MSYFDFRRISVWTCIAIAAFGSMTIIAGAVETSSTAWSLPPIHVVDESGKPLANAEAVMVGDKEPRIGFYLKQTDKNGDVKFSRNDYFFPSAKEFPKGIYDVMVRAQGFAPAYTSWELPTSSPLTVKVKPGTPVLLTLNSADGREVPEDLTPVLYPAKFGLYMQPQGDDDYTAQSIWPERTGPGKYRIVLDESTTTPLNLMVQDPDFLTGFFTTLETTSALKNGRVEVLLPRPGAVAVKLSVPENLTRAAAGKSLNFSLSKMIDMGDLKRTYVGVAGRKDKLSGDDLEYTVSYLAPGGYYASVNEATEEEIMQGQANRLPKYREGKGLEVAADTPANANFLFKQFDPNSMKGEGVAHVTVKKQDGSPAAGLAVRLKTYLPSFGQDFTITTGTLDKNGQITLHGLGTIDENSPAFDLTKDKDYSDTIGRIALRSGETSGTYEFTIPPEKGDIAPEITLFDINTNAPVTLSSLRGKIVFIDFWATWCGPCQAPMAHNQKVLEENGARWGDKVAIIGASIDADAKTVVDHVKKNGWEAVQHLWCGHGEFKSRPGEIYGINGVPTAFLIDQQGKIIWRGHPASFKLVKEVDKLLAEK